jgi:hypothetical protein
MEAATFTFGARLGAARPATRAAGARRSLVQPVRAAAETKETVDDLGFKLMRKGVKEAAKENLLTPRWVPRVARGPGDRGKQGFVAWAPHCVVGPPLAMAAAPAPASPLPALRRRRACPHLSPPMPTPPTLQLLHHRL